MIISYRRERFTRYYSGEALRKRHRIIDFNIFSTTTEPRDNNNATTTGATTDESLKDANITDITVDTQQSTYVCMQLRSTTQHLLINRKRVRKWTYTGTYRGVFINPH
jgi:hypothetical protein